MNVMIRDLCGFKNVNKQQKKIEKKSEKKKNLKDKIRKSLSFKNC